MVVTDEPGYYKDGEYGIRIENQLVIESKPSNYLGFMNLTLCPYDHNLIEMDLLSKRDIEYINAYHKRVYDEVSPLLKE